MYILFFSGGLTLFLLGIKIISSTFEKIVSFKLRKNVNKITSSKIKGLIIGILATALLQSSSATTIIIISLVHSNILNIYNAVPIIMGANIGTTFTSQLVAYKLDNFAHYLLILGLLSLIKIKNQRFKTIGKILIGLGLIFSGIEVIGYSFLPLKSSKFFTSILSYIDNNALYGIFAGFLITSIIQSSSTGVTMLQVMTSSGIISVHTCIPIILGQNIGTCVDTLVGSLATNKVGKQAAIIHLLFNILGVFIFYFFIEILYFTVVSITPNDPSRQIANAHTIFNLTTSLVLLPFSSNLVNLSKKVIKE